MKITVTNDFPACAAIRRRVFIEEQNVPEELELDELDATAVHLLAVQDGRMAQVVEMKYFAGLTEEEIATALGVTDRTVRRDWEQARATAPDFAIAYVRVIGQHPDMVAKAVA